MQILQSLFARSFRLTVIPALVPACASASAPWAAKRYCPSSGAFMSAVATGAAMASAAGASAAGGATAAASTIAAFMARDRGTCGEALLRERRRDTVSSNTEERRPDSASTPMATACGGRAA